jgi:hypothetical protein
LTNKPAYCQRKRIKKIKTRFKPGFIILLLLTVESAKAAAEYQQDKHQEEYECGTAATITVAHWITSLEKNLPVFIFHAHGKTYFLPHYSSQAKMLHPSPHNSLTKPSVSQQYLYIGNIDMAKIL